MSYTVTQVVRLMPDEIAYSYYLRLALANGLDIKTFASMVFPARQTGEEHRFVRYDIHDDGYQFFKLAGISAASGADFYHASLFTGLAPLMTRALASRHLGMLSRYRHPTSLISAADDMFVNLRYCPVCMSEAVYYRRAHQMPGVTACPVHGCLLCEYEGERGGELGSGAYCKEPASANDDDVSYARFAACFLSAELQSSITDVRDAVLSRIKDMAVQSQNAYSIVSDSRFLQSFTARNVSHTDASHCLRMLYDLFGTVDQLTAYLPPQAKMSLPDGYDLLSPYRADIVEVRCKTCGTVFITSPYRLISGWGCPECDSAVTDTALFERILRASMGADYELISPYTSMTGKVTLRHTVCGRVYDTLPRAIIEDCKRCSCGCASEDEICRRINETGHYRFVSYNQQTGRAEIIHNACGRPFSVSYKSFFRHRHCPICGHVEQTESSVRRKVADVVGDDYTVVQYNHSDKTAIIRHNICGGEQDYAVCMFLDGARCRACHQRLSYTDFVTFVSEFTNGEYAVVRRVNDDTVVIRQSRTGKERKAMMRYIIQEFLRPTPSKTLPVMLPNWNAKLPLSPGSRVMAWIRGRCSDGTAFKARDIEIDGMTSQQISKTVNNLCRSGMLVKCGHGVYTIASE